MKNKLRLRSLAFLATSPLIVVSLSTSASAASLEWAGSTTGLTGGTDQTWDTDTTANWWNGSTFVNWPALGGTDDDAVFGGTAGTVTITTVTANDITFNTTGYTLSGGALTLNGTTPTISNATGINAAISSVISGSSGLVKNGDGILTLSGSNGYSGTTVVNAGTLELSGVNSNASLQVNGAGALTRITAGTTTVASNNGDSYVTGGGTIEIDGGSLVITGGTAWFSVGDHPVIPDGDGTLTLTSGSFTNNNSWGIVVSEGNAGAGFVNINGGVFTANDTVNNSGLMLGNGTGASGTLNLNGGTLITDQIKGGPGSGTVNFNGGKLQATGDVFDIFQNNGSITTTIQSGGLKVGGTPNFAISEELGGAGALTKEDGNIVLLSGNNGYSGGTTITGGTIVAGNTSALGTGGLVMGGGALQAGIGPFNSTPLGNSIQINGTGNVFSAPVFYNLELNGNLTGSGTASVAGEWAVGLGGDNSGFTGTWITGNENPNNITRFDTANSGSASAAWVLNGGRMINSNNTSPTISLGSLSGTGGILSNNTGGQVTYSIGDLNTDATFSGQIVNEWGGGGSTAITKVGSGIWTLNGNLSYTGATVVNGGNLVIQTGVNYAGQSTSGYTLGNNSKLTFYSTNNPMIDKAITGSGDLYIDGNGAGNQYENRVNIMSDGLKTFSGSVYVLANGKLGVWGGDGSGAIPDASVVDVAGMFTLYGNSETISGLTGSGIVQGHNAVLTVDNATNQTFSGTLRKNPNEAGTFDLVKTAAGTLTLSGTTDNGDARATIESGTLVLAKDSPGVHAVGSYKTNALTINGGTCRLDGLGTDQIYDFSHVQMAGGTFDLNDREEGICGLTGSGGTITNNGLNFAARLTVGVGSLAGEVYTFAGTIQDGTGQVGLTKTEAGTLVLTGSSSYTDYTEVNGGTLKVDGSLGNTEVYVSSSALAGNGSIGGTVNLDNGGDLATRISDWSGTGGSGFDDLSVQSLQILTGTSHVITVDTTGLVNFSEVAKTFPIVLSASSITGFSAVDFSVSAPGFPGTGTWTVQLNGTNTNLELVYSPASASAYDSWATDKGLTEANNGKTLDPDDDGLTNLQEFAFDGDPLDGANDGKRVSVLADPDGAGPLTTALILTLPVRNTAVFNGPGDLVSDPLDGIIYQIQGSVDLVDFTAMNISEVTPALDSGLPALSTGWSYRSFRAPGPLGTREFIRAAVVESP